MITIIGIILALISIIGIHVGWRANEWREPLTEQYPDILKKLHEQSDGMIWLR